MNARLPVAVILPALVGFWSGCHSGGGDRPSADAASDRLPSWDGVQDAAGAGGTGGTLDASPAIPDGAAPPVSGAGGSGGELDASSIDGPPPRLRDASYSDVPFVERKLDLIFIVDNSPSMAPKQAKLQAQFPRLIEGLKDSNGDLPDLRIAILDTDLGTGGAWTSGSCGPQSNGSIYGDQGKFQMRGAAACGVTDPQALWLEYAAGTPANFTGDLATVFGCLATNLGTEGCGEEHQLQTLELALFVGGLGNEKQQTMLRPEAALGLVFLTDEDDCSAAPNDGMFGDKDGLRGESASLRCATRSHACGGNDLSGPPPAPGYPTTTAFEAPLASCSARTDACPNALDGVSGTDTSEPTSCSPLRDFSTIAGKLKQLKADPATQILVAGIFGWPLASDIYSTEPYKIAEIPNPNTYDKGHPQVFDLWPICYDPNHRPSKLDSTTGFDPDAAGWGAYPGLRMSAFIDQFGAQGLKYSICAPDFADVLGQIGHKLATNPYGATFPVTVVDGGADAAADAAMDATHDAAIDAREAGADRPSDTASDHAADRGSG